MQEELLQFKLQKVWTLVDLPYGKKAIGTKWVFQNKKDESGIVIRNKARLVAQGHTQEEYDKVFALVARIEAIRLLLAYAPLKDLVVYQKDVKSAFLYGKIEEEVYVCQPQGFEDPDFPDKVYKVEKALYRLHHAPRAWYETLSMYLLDNGFHRGKIDKTKELCNAFEKMMHEKFQMSSMGELTFFLGLQVKQKQDGIFISQDKYVAEILKKYDFSEVKNESTPMETQKPLLKDDDAEEVDIHIYRSMIGSLMYLTSSRLILCLQCVYVQAYTDSDYAGASLDRKSTTGGCQLLGCRLISWQCKKQTMVVNSTTEAEYVKIVNEEAQLQALLDEKKVIITESTIRRDLQLEDAKGVDCLPNAAIFEQLTLMGYEKLSEKLTFYKAFFSPQWKFLIHTILQCISAKTIAWNEFSSTMASSIICLATNQKFNFSKYIFGNMVKNLDSVTKFLMYPRKRLFRKSYTIISNNDGTSSRGNGCRTKRKDTELHQTSVPTSVEDEAVNEEMDDNLERVATTATSLDVEQDRGNISKAQSKATPNKPGSQGTSLGGGPRFSARVESSEDEGLGEANASKQGRITDIDANQDIYLVNVHKDKDIFGVNDDDVIVEDAEMLFDFVDDLRELKSVKPKTATTVTAASSRPKAKGIVIHDDGDKVTIDAIPLSSKSLTIFDYKIYQEGKKSYFHIFKADGNSQIYLTFSKMLKNFNSEDLEVIWRLVKDRFENVMPVNHMDRFLFHNLKAIFKHHVEYNVWKNQQGLVKMKNWKLYDSCRVHYVIM
nr:putative ribonuclease H-like domain-containing protein [Tanacetum cinerariifolium]